MKISRRDILLRSYEDEDDSDGHPYRYARLLGIYHARVSSLRQQYHVGWTSSLFAGSVVTQFNSGPRSLRLDRISFVPSDSPDPFGFVDPANLLRACHLAPAFVEGKLEIYCRFLLLETRTVIGLLRDVVCDLV